MSKKKIFAGAFAKTGSILMKVKNYKYTPKILMTAGIFTFIGSGVYACYKTLGLEERIDEAKAGIDHVKELKEAGEYVVNTETGETAEYTDKLYRKDIAYAYFNGIKLVAGPYVPSAIGVICGVGMITGGDAINTDRVAKITLAWNGAMKTLDTYRNNVRREYGDEADERMMTGVQTKKNFEMNVEDSETGEIVSKKEKKLDVIGGIGDVASPYAILLNRCGFYRKDANYNDICVDAKLEMLRAKLNAKHYLYFYDILQTFEYLGEMDEETEAMSHQTGIMENFGDGFLNARAITTHLGSEDKYTPVTLLDFNCIGGEWVDGKYLSFNDLVQGKYWKRV